MGSSGIRALRVRQTALASGLSALLVLAAPVRADYADGVFAENHISFETAVHIWRQAAWRNDDFLAEVKLGDIYANASDSRYYDPVEAYVWFYLAVHNRIGSTSYWGREADNLIDARRDHAFDRQSSMLFGFSSQERIEAHNRIVYILACRGAEGFIKLGRLNRMSQDHENEWNDNDDRGRHHDDFSRDAAGSSVMPPNDAEALTYFHIAESMGNPFARGYLNPIERRLRTDPLGSHIVDRQATSFHYWTPPFEFYPQGNSQSGVPLSDECVPNLERQRALVLASAIPAAAALHALDFLGWHGAGGIAHFQGSLPDEPTGKLTASQLVRLIQMAAVNGDAASQNTLGVMYAKGLGVVTNYVRAEYWFSKAADQRYPAALYHLGVLYKVGPPGIEQDLHKSNDYMTNSALAGFRPTMNQLGALLNAAASHPPHPGQN